MNMPTDEEIWETLNDDYAGLPDTKPNFEKYNFVRDINVVDTDDLWFCLAMMVKHPDFSPRQQGQGLFVKWSYIVEEINYYMKLRGKLIKSNNNIYVKSSFKIGNSSFVKGEQFTQQSIKKMYDGFASIFSVTTKLNNINEDFNQIISKLL